MQTSQKHPGSGGVHFYHHQPVKGIYQVLQSDSSSQGTSVSFESCKEQYFTLESCPAPTTGFMECDDSPSYASVSSKSSPFSPQGSHSCGSDHHQSSDNTYGSPISGLSSVDDGHELKHKLRELEISLLGPDESDIEDSFGCCVRGSSSRLDGASKQNWEQIAENIPRFDLKGVLRVCAQAVSDDDVGTARGWMDNVLGKMVSVSGDPIQRLGAYLLEGLRARLESSGNLIYKSLKCEQPTSKELMSYMHILYQICPYWRFAYISANAVITEAMANESRIHIIDFQVAQGTQWYLLIQALAQRPGGPPSLRVTGVDDSQSFHARGGGLEIVGERLSEFARSCGVPFEFHSAAMSGCEVVRGSVEIRPGEALAVNFPFVLHHMADESVSTENHRDRLLRLVKSLSPKVVTLVEQESNTNTSPFFYRFVETLDYYTAMFESIDVACPRDDQKRISAEQHCLARDIVNMIACEGSERVERHELLGKWRSRLSMAGFKQCQLSSSVMVATQNLLNEFSQNYRLEHKDDALYLGWMNRHMATSSAWR
ncbi:scarecrow-like protein 13 [Vigna unguiculata]|uniref:DELLA protein n=1 Tax=Vigna unguiculata TaxID=3917 RepID=A0A4D6KSY1_VIGUN|nr:scarecrow-like protein 13 [Vigna unguiculata]XP_027917835.1 scarecrow-like protein 13 [Vigna unguiculata]XP_027917836.1 scarecrow-like protein 13 [Vigna unguiculata]QCD79800.1 DELLA protein [Vigna unguiculata]